MTLCAYCGEEEATTIGRYAGYCSLVCKHNHGVSPSMSMKEAMAADRAFKILVRETNSRRAIDPMNIQQHSTVTCPHCSSKINHGSTPTVCPHCRRVL